LESLSQGGEEEKGMHRRGIKGDPQVRMPVLTLLQGVRKRIEQIDILEQSTWRPVKRRRRENTNWTEMVKREGNDRADILRRESLERKRYEHPGPRYHLHHAGPLGCRKQKEERARRDRGGKKKKKNKFRRKGGGRGGGGGK